VGPRPRHPVLGDRRDAIAAIASSRRLLVGIGLRDDACRSRGLGRNSIECCCSIREAVLSGCVSASGMERSTAGSGLEDTAFLGGSRSRTRSARAGRDVAR
jgi:hypothetical protein